ncbi:MAG: ATP-binding protein [Chloroflexota bacterium]
MLSKLIPSAVTPTLALKDEAVSYPPHGFEQSRWRKSIIIIALSLVIIDILHYSTAPGISQLHSVYRYFYFLPIAYAALRFGLWGGLIATISATLVFIPHIVMRWQDHPVDTLNDTLVVVVLFGVAVLTGRIADQMRDAQAKQAAIAEDLVRSYHQLENQGAELRQAERLVSLGTLAGGLAHQIRNPVGIIRASSQLLGDSPDGENGEIAKVIQSEADRIEQLVSRLLNYAGEQTVKRTETNIGNLLASVQQRVNFPAEPVSINVMIQCPKEVSTWSLDCDQMEQALVNLCMNAVQAIDESPQAKPSNEIHLQAQLTSSPDPTLEIIVSDNGPGIPAEILTQIFDPFFSTKESGTGLGLSVVQRIVEDHGGAIHIDSRQSCVASSGTTFTIQLPCPSANHQQFHNSPIHC